VVPTIKASTGATHHTASAYHAAIDVADRDFGEVGVSLDAVVHGVVLQISGRDDGWTGHATSTCEDAAPIRGDRRRVGALRDGGADEEMAARSATLEPTAMQMLPSLQRSLRILAPQRARTGGPVEATLARVIATFDELGVRWCLIGAHAVGEYTEPRATERVDLLVDDRRMPKLLSLLGDRLGPLDVDDIGAAVRLRALQIDLVRASANSVFRTALAEATTIDAWRIPTREALLVMKFMAATSPFRGLDRRRQDILDLVRLYRAIDPDDLDRAMISRLAGMMYGGADAELAELFGRIDRDEPISL
jgi:hypothetical protein